MSEVESHSYDKFNAVDLIVLVGLLVKVLFTVSDVSV